MRRSSPFFGNVYVCDAAFRSQEESAAPGADRPQLARPTAATRGASAGSRRASNNATDRRSAGLRRQHRQHGHGLRLLGRHRREDQDARDLHDRARSTAASTSSGRARIVTHIDRPGSSTRSPATSTFDGVAGARDGSFPTVDIANGAPTGDDATDQIVLAWSNGPTPSDTNPGPNEQVRVLTSQNGGDTWTSGRHGLAGERPAGLPGDRDRAGRNRRVPHVHELPAAVAVDHRGAADVPGSRPARRRRPAERSAPGATSTAARPAMRAAPARTP